MESIREKICREISEYVRDLYSYHRECLKHIDLQISLIDKICSGHMYPEEMINRSIYQLRENLRGIRELCSEARSELSRDMDITTWRKYEDLYLSITRTNEYLRNTIHSMNLLIRKLLSIALLELFLFILFAIGLIIESEMILEGLLILLVYSSIILYSISYIRTKPTRTFSIILISVISLIIPAMITGAPNYALILSFSLLVVTSIYAYTRVRSVLYKEF